MASNKTFAEFMEICEKFSMAADTSKPQSAKATKLPRSREGNVGTHDDWKDKVPTEWNDKTTEQKKKNKLRSRASAVVGTQQRQDVETGVRKEEAQLDELRITRMSPEKQEVKRRAKNIKNIRTKRETLAALMKHAELQKKGLADEVEYDGENVDEVLMVTPATKKPTKKVVKSVTKIEKPDPSDPDYVTMQRAYVKSKQQEAIDYERLRSGAEAANARAAAVKKAKLQRQQSDAEAARSAFRTKGVPFSDAKGSGHIVNGKKVYAS